VLEHLVVVVGLLEVELEVRRIDDDRCLSLDHVLGLVEPGAGDRGICDETERECDVVGRDRLAVVPAVRRIRLDLDHEPVVGERPALVDLRLELHFAVEVGVESAMFVK
jgi:hypothetical protein